MGTYHVDTPAGGPWAVGVNPDQGAVRFVNPPSALSAPGPVRSIFINVSWNAAKDQRMGKLSEAQLADHYLDGEIQDMKVNGVAPGYYELHDVKKAVAQVNGKKLYTLSYKQKGGAWFPNDLAANAITYLYFPDNYNDTHRFYQFIYSELTDINQKPRGDFAPVLQVIKSFGIKEGIN
jgi:hypothetical protein